MKNKYLLLVSEDEKKYLSSLKYSFDEKKMIIVKYDNMNNNDINELASTINKKCKKVIFFDYNYNFIVLLSLICKEIEVNWIFKYSIPYFCNNDIYKNFLQIIEYKNRGLINNIYCLDYNLFYSFKDKYGFKYLMLNYSKKSENRNKKFNSVGVIGFDYDEGSNFFNSLSALTMKDHGEVKVENMMTVTSNFGTNFNLNINKYNNYEEVIKNNKINLYCAFSNIIIPIVLESFENGVPCIVGNTDLFDNNAFLKENLVLNSDDSIDEISNKISYVINNRDRVMKEYHLFKKNYDKDFQNNISLLIN